MHAGIKEGQPAPPIYHVARHAFADVFPDPADALADPNGLLAVGGDLSLPRLLEAYRSGIFPWYSDGQPILWWSPNPRTVFYPDRIRISRSLRRTLRRRPFELSFNRAFSAVIHACAEPRDAHGGTWLTADMIKAYQTMHLAGYAHSVEAWQEGRLAGGLYGVCIGGIFFGESMFSRVSDASKVALVHLAGHLCAHGAGLIDCQISSQHLSRLGAVAIPRSRFTALLLELRDKPLAPEAWPRPSLADD